jgi:hypothetical protein
MGPWPDDLGKSKPVANERVLCVMGASAWGSALGWYSGDSQRWESYSNKRLHAR